MPYEIIEKKLKAVPEEALSEISDFLDFMIYKFSKTKTDNAETKENEALERVREAGMKTVWESVKNDAW